MTKSERFVKAHKMTRDIKEVDPTVNYRVQFGLCLSYICKEGEKEMVELKGSEKQVAWAEKIKNKFLTSNKEKFEKKIALYSKLKRTELVEKETNMYNTILEKVNTECRAVWFIEVVGNSDRDYKYIFENLTTIERQSRL